VLVLSGGYPQPGWGALVEWRRDIRQFENLISRTITRLRDKDSTNKLNVFTEAAQSFHRWQDLRNRPAKLNVSSLEGEILTADKVESLMREAQTALQASEHRLVGDKIIAAMQGAQQVAWLNISDSSFQRLLDTLRTLLTAASLSAVSRRDLATEIEPKLAALIADPSLRETAFRNLSSDELKHALKACLDLRTKNVVRENESFQVWGSGFWLRYHQRLERTWLS
jgi:hypothetical protein